MNERIISLLYRLIINDELTNLEEDELGEWVYRSPHNRALIDEVTNFRRMEKEFKILISYDKKRTWNKIREKIALEKLKMG